MKGTEDYGVITKRQVVDFIKANPKADEYIITIHSPGGDVAEGFAIHDALIRSGKKITTIGEGLVASIATIIFLAGSTRKLTENTDFFIHNPWSDPYHMSGFTAEDYRRMAEDIQKAEDKILNFYVAKTGGDAEYLKGLMDEQTTIPADDALELKFATEVLATNKVNARVQAYLGAYHTNKTDKNSDTMSNKALTALLAGLNSLTKSVEKMNKPKGESTENTEASTVEVTLDDGRTMVVEAAGDVPAVGDAVTIDGETPEDGNFTDEAGNVYAIVGGKIETITPAAADNKDDEKNTDAAKAQAAKDAKDPAKLNARLVKMEAEVKKYQDQVKAANIAKKKAEDEKAEIENALPTVLAQIEALGKKFEVLAKSTTSEHETGERQADTSHHEKTDAKKSSGNIADAAVASKKADDVKRHEKNAKKSLWANQD